MIGKKGAAAGYGLILAAAIALMSVGNVTAVTVTEPETVAEEEISSMDAEEQESAFAYDLFFKPENFGFSEAFVGDPMPYYEDGTYYIYYLKEGGDSFHHSVYLTTTQDFVSYQEYETPMIEASGEGQEDWIGTGSVVKTSDRYLFFYTAHADAEEYHEKIYAAESTDLISFEKIQGFEMVPDEEIGQKNDFRDPQAYYDPETGKIKMTITAAVDGTARILKYSLDADLTNAAYEGIIFTDPTGDFWNLECSDTFKMGDKWYLTYSGQDDTLWYAKADEQYGPYDEPKRLEGKLFYAAKHVEDGEGSYMVGWARRSDNPFSRTVTAWAGNLMVQEMKQKENGDLYLTVPEQIRNAFPEEQSFTDTVSATETFKVTGSFIFRDAGTFGMAMEDKYISIDPEAGLLQLGFAEGKLPIAETAVELKDGETYSFTYMQDGSAGLFCIDGIGTLTVRIYGTCGKKIRFWSENSQMEWKDLAFSTR